MRYNGNGNGAYGRERENKASVEINYEGDVKGRLREVYKGKLDGQKGALLLDGNLDVIKKVGARDIPKSVKGSRTRVAAIVLEGSTTVSLINLCDEQGISYLAATNFGGTVDGAKVELVSL